MQKLTREEVLHVASLARIEIDEDEIEKYSITLKQLLNDIDKIKTIENEKEEVLVTPTHHLASLREKDEMRKVDFETFQKNMPKSVGKFVEVPVVIEHE